MAKDYYSELGIGKNATDDEIKSAYRTQAKKYHPDLNKNNPNAEQKFKEVNEAYSVLSDAEKRSNYDQFGSQEGYNPNNAGAGFNAQDFGGFEDIFNIFGFGGGKRGASSASAREQGDSLEINIKITLGEACNGCEKEVLISRKERCDSCKGSGARAGSERVTCSDCRGTGQVQFVQNTLFGRITNVGTCRACGGTGKVVKDKCPDCRGAGVKTVSKNVNIKIPAGIDTDQTLRMRGEGNMTASTNGESGDLLVHIIVAAHPMLERKGFDLYSDVYVPFTTLLLGGKIQVPTIDGSTAIDVPPLTQNNTHMTLRGKGIKYLRTMGSGDLIITLKGEIPKSLDKQVKSALKDIEDNIKLTDYPKTNSYNKKLEK